MNSNYNPPNFKDINQEICDALSTLKKHGINIEFNEGLRKRFDDLILFDGDDGLFKSLIKILILILNMGVVKVLNIYIDILIVIFIRLILIKNG